MANTSAVLIFSLLAYLLSSVLYVSNLLLRRPRTGVAPTVLAGAGVLAQTLGLLLIVTESHPHRSPYSTFYGAVAFVAWLVVLMQLLLTGRYRMYALGAFSMPIAFLMTLVALTLPSGMHRLLPTLEKHTMAAHISVSLLAYGAFTVAFGLSILYLVENRLLKARKIRGMFQRLPPLRTTEELACRFATFGLAMLTLGLLIGTVYALREWKGSFFQDPKVLPALATWGIYAVYLVLRWGVGWRGRAASYLLLGGVSGRAPHLRGS